jgi:hypothetical protein
MGARLRGLCTYVGGDTESLKNTFVGAARQQTAQKNANRFNPCARCCRAAYYAAMKRLLAALTWMTFKGLPEISSTRASRPTH